MDPYTRQGDSAPNHRGGYAPDTPVSPNGRARDHRPLNLYPNGYWCAFKGTDSNAQARGQES